MNMQKEYDALTTKKQLPRLQQQEGDNVKNIAYKQTNSNSETDVTLFTRLEEIVSQEASMLIK